MKPWAKKMISVGCAATMLATQMISAGAYTTSRECVVGYKDGDRQGAAVAFPVGEYHLGLAPGIGANQLSSLNVPYGYIVTLTDANGQTKKFTRQNKKSNYAGYYNELVNLTETDWNDRAVKIKVEKGSPNEYEQLTYNASYYSTNRVILADEPNVQNRSWCGVIKSGANYDVGPGSYLRGSLSSMYLPQNTVATLIDDYGNTKVYLPGMGMNNLGTDEYGKTWDNRAVLVKLEKVSDEELKKRYANLGYSQRHVTFFTDSQYGSKQVALGEGTHDLSKSASFGARNQLSSLYVPEGFIVTLYGENNKELHRYCDTNNYDLGDWNDKVNWVKVEHPNPDMYNVIRKRYETADAILARAVAEGSVNPPAKATTSALDSTMEVTGMDVKIIPDLEKKEKEVIYSGVTTWTNHDTKEQKSFTTLEFDFQVKNGSTTSATHIIGTSLATKASLKFGDLGAEMTLTVKYDFSTTSSQTHEQTVTYKVPRQTVIVGPGETVQVRAILERSRVSGMTQMTGRLTGREVGNVAINGSGKSLTKSYNFNIDEPISGTAFYEATYGGDLKIELVNLTTNEKYEKKLDMEGTNVVANGENSENAVVSMAQDNQAINMSKNVAAADRLVSTTAKADATVEVDRTTNEESKPEENKPGVDIPADQSTKPAIDDSQFGVMPTGEDLKVSTPTGEQIFNDVKTSDWHAPAVNYIAGHGWMKGTSDTKFTPNGKATRAMATTVLYRMDSAATGTSSKFIDVQPGDYFADSVSWAYENNIVTGVTSTTFAPYRNITREQFASIVYRYLSYKGYAEPTTDLTGITDADEISDWAKGPIASLSAQGILKGNDGKINPQTEITRAEMATILMRVSQLFNA